MKYKIIDDVEYQNTVDGLEVETEAFNRIMQDMRLSLKAKGIMIVAMESQRNGEFTLYDLLRCKADKRDSALNGIKELIKHGYIEKRKEQPDEGYIYVVGDSYGNYKIGYAKDFAERLMAYQTAMPNEPEVLAVIPSDNMRSLEKELHNKFKNKHIRGEWFRLQPKDIQYIEELERA